jgi:hypothetical protein
VANDSCSASSRKGAGVLFYKGGDSMSNGLPDIGADIVLEFQQSINNVQLFGQAMEGLDTKFGNMERRIDGMRSSLSSLSSQVSRGSGNNLRTQLTQELNTLIASNGVVLSKIGNTPFKVKADTLRNVFAKVENELNAKLAQSYQNISLEVAPNLQVGKIPLDKTDLDEVNKAIARLVKVQLNNLVSAMRKSGAGMISAQDLSSIQLHIGKDTVQQIINRIKDHIKTILLNPNLGTGASFTITDADMNKVFTSIKTKIKGSLDDAIAKINGGSPRNILPNNVQAIYTSINTIAKEYITSVTRGINSMGHSSMTVPLGQVSKQLQQSMAKHLGVDMQSFQQQFANHKFTNADISTANLRNQFGKLEQALNKKIGGGLADEVKAMVAQINGVNINYSPKLHRHLIQEIGRINNSIVKKIREQIDIQFLHMNAEINSVQVNPKDINRIRRVRDMGRVDVDPQTRQPISNNQNKALANDPYAKRDNFMNGFGLQGAMTNTFRHILAGSMVGAPMMMLYQALESFKVSQLESVKMFSNLMLKDEYKVKDSSGNSTADIDFQKVSTDIQEVKPYLDNAAEFYAMPKADTYQVGSVGARVSDNITQLQEFVNVVGQIRAIDYEANPVTQIAPGVEAFKGQFGLAIGEMGDRVVKPLAVATNKTNASTANVLDVIKRSGSAFKSANISPEMAIAFGSVTAQQTGQSGSTVGNFYSNSLKKLTAPESKAYLEDLGIQVINPKNGSMRDGTDILREIADKFNNSPDGTSRDLIQKVFGSYQGTRAGATLDAMDSQYGGIDKLAEIMKAYEAWGIGSTDKSSPQYKRGESEFGQMMQNQTQAPIITMDRAGVSMNLAMVSIMEEFTPAIVKVSEELTQMSQKVRDNSGAIAQFIGILSSALIGLATVKGIKSLYGKSGITGRAEDMRTKDMLFGNRSAVKGWQRDSVLGGLTSVHNQDLLNGSVGNRRFVNKALKDKDLAPYVQHLANMKPEDITRMNAYIKDNGLMVANHKELLMASHESRGYQIPETDPLKRQGNASRSASLLVNPKNAHVDQGFMQNFVTELRDTQKFSQLGQTQHGANVLGFMSGIDDKGLEGFNAHISDMHGKTGKVITDVHGLSNAVSDYKKQQSLAREEMRRTSGEYTRMSEAINRTGRGSLGQKGAGALGGLSALGRGAMGSIGGMAMGGLAGIGMGAVYALVGEAIKGVAYNVSTSVEERDMDEKQRAVDEVNKTMKDTHLNGWNRGWSQTGQMWNGISDMFKEGNVEVDAGDVVRTQTELDKFVKDKYGKDLSSYKKSEWSLDMKAFVDEQTKATKDDKNPFTERGMITEFLNQGGDGSRAKELQKVQGEKFKRDYDIQLKEQINQKVLQAEVIAVREKRYNEATAKEDYSYYDYEERNTAVQTKVKNIDTANSVETLQKLLGGMSTDSEEYITLRRAQSDKLKEVYQDELKNLDEIIAGIKLQIVDAKKAGDTEKVGSLESQLVQRGKDKQKADADYKVTDLQNDVTNKQNEFDTHVNNVTRNLSLIDGKYNQRDTANALTMDRNSSGFVDANIASEKAKIEELKPQLEQLKSSATTDDEIKKLAPQIQQLEGTIQQSKVKIRDLSLTKVGIYKQGLNDQLEQMSVDYMQAKADSKITDDNNPYLRNLRIDQYNKQVGTFGGIISDKQKELAGTSDPEAQKSIQREIRDLQRQSLTAQLGILDEMKNTGGTFNMPENVKAMTYYEYLTKNNTHSTYTVQGGDTNVTVTLPNISDGTSTERIKQIGKALGEGMNEGKNLRLQKQANPFGYRG